MRKTSILLIAAVAVFCVQGHWNENNKHPRRGDHDGRRPPHPPHRDDGNSTDLPAMDDHPNMPHHPRWWNQSHEENSTEPFLDHHWRNHSTNETDPFTERHWRNHSANETDSFPDRHWRNHSINETDPEHHRLQFSWPWNWGKKPHGKKNETHNESEPHNCTHNETHNETDDHDGKRKPHLA